jgi:hypothetical protein
MILFMKIEIHFNPRTILRLLFAVIAVNALSLFLLTRIDNLVHSGLYKYGLNFNPEWATQYWIHMRLLINAMAISTVLILMAVATFLIYIRKHRISSRYLCLILLTGAATLTVFSAYLFNRLDYVINHDLYQYGLHFSYEWAINYWIYCGLILGLTGLASATTLISMALILLDTKKIIKIAPAKVASSTLVIIGAATLTLSVLYNSSILAFIGLGLTFWGAILAYIRTEEYIKGKLLDATALTPLAILNQIMQELRHEGKAVYLPPKYLKDPEDNKAYIPKQKCGQLPTPEQIQEQDMGIFIESPKGILLTPPGAELTKLFEKTLETSFTRIDFQHFQQIMPKLFIEDLEIAQNLEITAEDNKVLVRIENSNYQNLTRETEKFSKLYDSLGCSLSSAIACALAKATGKPVTIEKQQLNEENKAMEIEYHLLEEEQNQQ